MKKIYLLSVLLFSAATLFAQISLTYSGNALVTGQNNSYQELQFVDPGQAGSNQIWDFSKIKITGQNPVASMDTKASKSPDGIGNYNLVLNESGSEYFFDISENGFREVGMYSKDKETSLVYTDPIQKMTYPFTYGGHIGDKFAGYAYYKDVTRIDFMGDYTVDADAFGTLILPDRVLKNVLRIKVIKTGIERYMCGSTELNAERYFWYAPGYRYPVLSISIITHQVGGQSPTTTKSASLNITQQQENTDIATGIANPDNTDKSDVSVIIYPNPFSEKVTYNYYLRKEMNVSVDLYDITGKLVSHVVKPGYQTEGLYTGDIKSEVNNMRPGIYYLRFTFDNKVITNKIVKI